MLKNRFKPIYVDLDDGKWYVTNETSDSNLRSLRVRVNVASDSWYVQHWRRTTKVYFQILDNTNSEIVPQLITIIDENSIRIEFSELTSGTLHLVFDKDEFFDI